MPNKRSPLKLEIHRQRALQRGYVPSSSKRDPAGDRPDDQGREQRSVPKGLPWHLLKLSPPRTAMGDSETLDTRDSRSPSRHGRRMTREPSELPPHHLTPREPSELPPHLRKLPPPPPLPPPRSKPSTAPDSTGPSACHDRTRSRSRDAKRRTLGEGPDWSCPECGAITPGRRQKCVECSYRKPLGKVRPGDWECPDCGASVYATKTKCGKCGFSKPGGGGGSGSFPLKKGDWHCGYCDAMNFASNHNCFKCGAHRVWSLARDDDLEDWKCSDCKATVFASRSKCFKCGAPRTARLRNQGFKESDAMNVGHNSDKERKLFAHVTAEDLRVCKKVCLQNVPVECKLEDVHLLLQGVGVEAIQLVIHPSTDPGLETCACSLYFADERNAEQAVDTLQDTAMATRSGIQKYICAQLVDEELNAESGSDAVINDAPKDDVRLHDFCQRWALTSSTVAWLGALHPEVQAAVCEEFDSFGDSGIVTEDEVLQSPSTRFIITGLSKEFAHNSLDPVLRQLGAVVKCKFVRSGMASAGVTALVEMKTVEDAKVVFEDLNCATLVNHDQTTPLVVRYEVHEHAKLSEVPTGVTLIGLVSDWSDEAGYGHITLDGFTPQVTIHASVLSDTTSLKVGANILCKAEWSSTQETFCATTCVADLAKVKSQLTASVGIGKAVRDFARLVQKTVQKGSNDIEIDTSV